MFGGAATLTASSRSSGWIENAWCQQMPYERIRCAATPGSDTECFWHAKRGRRVPRICLSSDTWPTEKSIAFLVAKVSGPGLSAEIKDLPKLPMDLK